MIEFGAFLTALTGSPVLVIVLLLTLGATVVNGATDAPNAIATVVGTRSMSPGAAIIMAAICNFIGLLAVTTIGAAVAKTIFTMANFGEITKRLCLRWRQLWLPLLPGVLSRGFLVFPLRRAIP